MQTLQAISGRLLYWLILPGLIILLPFTKRTRVLLAVDDQVLVVKAWMHNGRWHLPGGGLHRGEDPAVGAQRELLEETGLQLPIELFANPLPRVFREGLTHFPYHLFVIRLDRTQPVTRQLPEIMDAQWLDRNELTISNASNDILEALKESEKH